MPGRQTLGFPPYTHLVLLQFRSEDEQEAAQAATNFGKILPKMLKPDVQVMGPMPAPIAKLVGKFRYQILLRAADVRGMVAACKSAMAKMPAKELRKVPVEVDVDPRFLQ
ncbi:MAG: hypothetical protein MJ202_03200 [Lentisphaeria bacterium]|nr:hypothetical protein [Lentisphaeria bacterium]